MTEKKLIYITSWDFTDAEANGVCKKIFSQIKAFRKAGLSVDYTYIKNGSTWINKAGVEILLGHNHHMSKLAAHRLIAGYVKENAYPCVYIRYNKADPDFIRLVKRLKEEGSCILVEIPTYPYDNECKGCLRDRMVLMVDKMYRGKIHKYIDSFVSYSDDTEIFGAPSMHVMNGIDMDTVEPIKPEEKKDDTINLIAVAAFAPSHGYDRMIRSLGEYYNNGGKRNISFHMVGYGELVKEYERLIKQYHLEAHVILYGKKFGKELDEIYNKADIGICKLGCFRISTSIVSSELKSKEYAARGIPMVSACQMDTFPQEEYKYIHIFSGDESNISINELISFYESVYKDTDRSKIITDIRQYAGMHCSMEVVMCEIIKFYKK